MDTKTNVGCTILIAWLFGIVFFFFAHPFSSSTPASVNSLGDLNTSNPSAVTTLEPSSTKTPFVVKDNEVIYGHTDTLNCQRVISGSINYTDPNQKESNLVVVIELLEDSGNTPVSHILPGTAPAYGSSGWSVLVPNYSLYYLVWLENTSTGQILSPQVPITTQSCENKLAIINFVQVTPIQ
jgi:hypothetical protein